MRREQPLVRGSPVRGSWDRRKIGAHHKRIDKEAHEFFKRPFTAARDGGTDRDVVAAPRRARRAAKPAWRTMNRLAPVA